ncbi:MAG: efflux RND transporter permease subunit, partial [Thermodesulfobacteriota bacterium]
FGNTAAIMLTVASPKESGVEVELRAKNIKSAIENIRAGIPEEQREFRISFGIGLPYSVDKESLDNTFSILSKSLVDGNLARDIYRIRGPGFIGIDASLNTDKNKFHIYLQNFSNEKLGFSGFHIDAWDPVLIFDPKETERTLKSVAGDKYNYRDLENFTDLISETIQTIAEVSIVQRSGVLQEAIYLEYSQDRLASYGIVPADIKQKLNQRNIVLPGGEFEIGDNEIIVYPSGQFNKIEEIGDVIITKTQQGVPVYLRDLGEIVRGYQSPPQYLNFYRWMDSNGKWYRSRAVTVSAQMRSGQQIGEFGKALDAAISQLRLLLPEDLIIAKTSDQPRQVSENIKLFTDALMEAIILVVIIAWIGFREWRSALLMAISIPLTLAISLGLATLLGIELQQVSIATLIIALGLLVDDPVVANDAIKTNLALGHPPIIASWLGPTKLARAIMFSTVTNIVAYLPYLLITGKTGEFIYSLPIVMACALIASRLVSMTFVPLLGYYLVKRKEASELTLDEKRRVGFTGFYYRIAKYAIENRKRVFVISLIFFVLGAVLVGRLKISFFPHDVQYLSYIDVWLPNDATLSSSNDVVEKAEFIIQSVSSKYAEKKGKDKAVLESITSFIGGGGPRFWSTVAPEQRQRNYAQLIIILSNKNDTPILAPLFQRALSEKIPGAVLEVRQLQLNAVDYPIQIQLSGRADISSEHLVEEQDIKTLRSLADELKDILRKIPETASVRDDWWEDSFVVKLKVDPDRANLSGITNQDVAVSSALGLSGDTLTYFKEGDKQIPVLARLQLDERVELSDLQSLYVYAIGGTQKVPLLEVSSIDYNMETSRVVRREHFRTITVIAFPKAGDLPSIILKKAQPEIDNFIENLPPGYTVVWAGEKAKQMKGFRNLAFVLLISVTAIFLALVLQFKNAIKPFLVLAAVPYGVIGSLIALWIMGEPFGFMAFLGIASLVGVIVSHVIVLFDYIEEMHSRGESFEDSLLDAGIERLRPILITVGATIFALVPLAIHGGPLWQPLCYAQIGGLAVATIIELLLVPVFYAIFVLDLKIIKWEKI